MLDNAESAQMLIPAAVALGVMAFLFATAILWF